MNYTTKAKVQYNDFVGTMAADGADPYNAGVLDRVLKDNGVDTNRYHPVGFDFYSGGGAYCDFTIICEDKVDNILVEVDFEKKWSLEQFFNLFKRFNIISTSKYAQIDGMEINPDHISINNR